MGKRSKQEVHSLSDKVKNLYRMRRNKRKAEDKKIAAGSLVPQTLAASAEALRRSRLTRSQRIMEDLRAGRRRWTRMLHSSYGFVNAYKR